MPQNSRNMPSKPSTLSGAGTGRYGGVPDYYDSYNQGFVQEKPKQQMYQKNSKNVILAPLNGGNIVGNSTPNLKQSVDNFGTMNKKSNNLISFAINNCFSP